MYSRYTSGRPTRRASSSRPNSPEDYRYHTSSRSGTGSRDHSPDDYRSKYSQYRTRPAAPTSHPPLPPSIQRAGIALAESNNGSYKSSPRRYPPSPYVEDWAQGIAREAKLHDDVDLFNIPEPGALDQPYTMIELEVPVVIAPRPSCPSNVPDGPKLGGDGYGLMKQPSADRTSRSSASTTPREDAFRRSVTPSSRSASPSSAFWTPAQSDVSKTSSIDSGYYSTADSRPQKSGIGFDGKAFAEALKNNQRQNRGSPPVSTPRSRPSSRGGDNDRSSNTRTPAERRSAPYSFPALGISEKTALRNVITPEPSPRATEYQINTHDGPARSDLVVGSAKIEHTKSFSISGPVPPASSASIPPGARFTSNPLPTIRSMSLNDFPVPESSGKRSPRSPASRSPNNSRPSSPTGSHPSMRADEPLQGIRRVSTFPTRIEAVHTSMPSSSLAHSSMTIDEMETPASCGSSKAENVSSVPYPVDDFTMMPSVERHQHHQQQPLSDYGVMTRPPPNQHSSYNAPRPAPINTFVIRPGMPLSSQTTPVVPTLGNMNNTSPHASGHHPQIAPMSPHMTNRPHLGHRHSSRSCLQRQNAENFHDWYTVHDGPAYEFCPNCYDKYLRGTRLEKAVERNNRKAYDPAVRCCLTSKWYRLAWKITREERRKDLDLLSKVARAERNFADHPCPADEVITGKCWTLRGSHSSFYLCQSDAQKLRKLMPELDHDLCEVRPPYQSYCSLREGSGRFERFTKMLSDIDYEAHKKKRKPELSEFKRFYDMLASVPECQRDTPVLDRQWHRAPQLPEFTICQECYCTVVWPEIAKGSYVARRIDKSPHTVHKDVEEVDAEDQPVELHPGITCQLYSDRMQKLFIEAVRREDWSIIGHEAVRRARKERHLQADLIMLQTKQRNLELRGDFAGRWNQEAELHDQARALAARWLDYE